jgi:hypothetical protein
MVIRVSEPLPYELAIFTSDGSAAIRLSGSGPMQRTIDRPKLSKGIYLLGGKIGDVQISKQFGVF